MADDWFRATFVYAVLMPSDRGQWRAAADAAARLVLLGLPLLVGATALAALAGGPLASAAASVVVVAALVGAFPLSAGSGIERLRPRWSGEGDPRSGARRRCWTAPERADRAR
jgi:hypothetical protein